jgi:transcriptional regulator with XRE-family HTH domain
LSSIEDTIDFTKLLDRLRSTPWAGPGPIVRELRRGRGLRLKHIAEKTGLSVGYLSRLERNEAGGDNPSITNLELLAHALDVPLNALLPSKSDVLIQESDLAKGILGREVLLAVTYNQPTTLPVLERLCACAGSPVEIATALEKLIENGLIRAFPPIEPGSPIFYVLEWEKHL